MSPCTNCGHPEHEHGDRAIGGSCDHGIHYPQICACNGYTTKGNAT